MWTILKRQCSAVWFASADDAGRVVFGEPRVAEMIEPSVVELLAENAGETSVGVEEIEIGEATIVLSCFAEGCVAALPSSRGNTMTIKAALRRWPGDEMIEAASAGPEEESHFSASRTLLAGDGLDEATNVADYESLDVESFAEEVVNGERGGVSEHDSHEETRIMACTWIQVVEHFGRIAEMIEQRLGVENPTGQFDDGSSPLGRRLFVIDGDFATENPSERVGSAEAEAVDATYRRWITGVSDADIRQVLPVVEATPWRGLLSERDAPVEEISFSI